VWYCKVRCIVTIFSMSFLTVFNIYLIFSTKRQVTDLSLTFYSGKFCWRNWNQCCCLSCSVKQILFVLNKNPTRCNSMQSGSFYCKVTLHVSGVTVPIIRILKTSTSASGTGHNIGTANSLQRGQVPTILMMVKCSLQLCSVLIVCDLWSGFEF